jgi:hypothetical protein
LERIAVALLYSTHVANELEQRAAGGREELGPVSSADEEAHVGLVLEGLPAQGKTYTVVPRPQRA